MMGISAIAQLAIAQLPSFEAEVGAGAGPAWRRIAAQRVLSTVDLEEEEAVLLLLS